jgi:hypothetical protein
MNDLLWLANRPLWGNVVGILTSWNPNTLEGLESRLSVGIRRILVELPHSIELELEKVHWTQMDFTELPRSTYSEDCRQAGKSSSPHNLASLTTAQRMNLGAL